MADGAEHAKVVEAAGVIGLATLLSRVLGFARDMVLARLFGAAPAADAFFVAYRIPNLLRELFAEGSMSAAFIPVFSEYLAQRTKRDAWELASAAFTTLLTILTGVCVLGIFASPWIVRLIAPGFSGDAEQEALTTLLTRIMFPYLLFIGLAALAMGVLNSVRSFAAPAFSPVLFNIAIIAAAFFLAPLFAEPILAVAVGVVIGGLAQFLSQMPALRQAGLLFGWRFDFAHEGVRRIGWLMAPALIGLSVTQINILVSTILASYFPGGPTYLFYGMRLIHFPLGIFGVALATALLPSLSTQAAKGELDALRGTLGFGLRLATALSAILNMAVLLVFLARRLGAFGWEAILRSHARVVLASVPIVVTCLWIAGLGVWTQPAAWVAKTVMLIVGMGISVASYVTVHALLGSDELDFLWGLVRRKITQTAS